jgi:hypothetical protein
MRLPIPLAWALLLSAAAPVATQGLGDMAVKAKVAVAIVRFVEFPEPRAVGHPLRFCVASKAPLSRAFMEAIQQTGRAIEVDPDIAAVTDGCDVLYVDASVPDWRRLLAASRTGLLTIGDVPGFLAAGGAVELILTNDAVRFDVNQQELRRARVRIPAQVLRLARAVRN